MSFFDNETLLSRRQAIVKGVRTAAAVAVGSTLLPSAEVQAQTPQAAKTPEVKIPPKVERLRAAGLEDFFFYAFAADEALTTFLASPSRSDAEQMTLILVGAANEEQIARFRDGWGEKKDEAKQLAKEKVQKSTIDTSATGDNEDDVRKMLDRAAETFPAMVLASPDHYVMQDSGGYYASGKEIGLSSTKDKEDAVLTLLHEESHAIDDNWEAIKPYVDRKKYAKYAGLKLSNTLNLFKRWLELPWDQASSFELFINPYQPEKEVFKKQVENLEKTYGASLEGNIPPDKMEDLVYRYNRITHSVGRIMVNVAKKQKDNQLPTPEEKRIREHIFTANLMQTALNETDHYFAEPYLQDGGTQFRDTQQYRFGARFKERAGLEVQKARVGAFSTLPETDDFNMIRKAFDLPFTTKTPLEPYRREAAPVEDLFPILTRYGFVPMFELPLFKGENDKRSVGRFYSLPVNPNAPSIKTMLMEFRIPGQSSYRPILIELPQSQFHQDFNRWSLAFNKAPKIGEPDRLAIGIPNRPTLNIELHDAFTKVPPKDIAHVIGLTEQPEEISLGIDVLHAPFAVKRTSADFRSPGVPTSSRAVYWRYGSSSEQIGYWPISETMQPSTGALLLQNMFHNVVIAKDTATGAFQTLISGKVDIEYESTYFPSPEKPALINRGGNRVSLSYFDFQDFLVPEKYMPDFNQIVAQQKTGPNFHFRLIPTRYEADDNPNAQAQVRYILEATTFGKDGVLASKKRFPIYPLVTPILEYPVGSRARDDMSVR